MADKMSITEYRKLIKSEWTGDPLNKLKYGNRGMAFEEDLDLTNQKYEQLGIAIIHKRPTPIKPLKFDKQSGMITKAVFDEKSTVDFDGTYKSMSLYYEAKTTSKPYFPLENVSNHQVEHLIKQANVGALCFFLVHFEKTQDTYVFPLQSLLYYWSRWKAKKRGYRHIPIDDFNTYAFKVKNTARARLDYLNQVDTLIKLLEEKDEA